jgi:hypothetical protein
MGYIMTKYYTFYTPLNRMGRAIVDCTWGYVQWEQEQQEEQMYLDRMEEEDREWNLQWERENGN